MYSNNIMQVEGAFTNLKVFALCLGPDLQGAFALFNFHIKC